MLTDPRYRALTRDNLAYSLEVPDRLVADVRIWANDWAAMAATLPSALPKTAILGRVNLLFNATEFQRWCASNGWTAQLVEDEGQLLLYGRPDSLIDGLRRLT